MIELARCHICAALMPDTDEDRRDHVGEHANVKKRLDAMTRSLNYLNGEIERAHAAVDAATTRIAELEAHPGTAGDAEGLTINEFPDDETETGDDTNLADLHDINPQNLEQAAAETPEDDLDERIANLSGVAPTVTPIA